MKLTSFCAQALSGLLLWAIVGMAWANQAEPLDLSQQLSEHEFLAEIPMVYSASRLPQQPRDSAGAITVINRELIRASGARDIADLFRLVPGFQVGTSSGGRSVVSYHGLSGQISQRMQVYIDGRSLYAPYLFGGVDWSAINVPLEEIDRIEIQRGSNSVTYGANAFLGVIHIFTRAASQSAGVYGQITQGNNGIADRHVRWGQSLPTAQWRLAAGNKSDDGLDGRMDPYDVEYLDFRAELQPASNQEWSVLAGLTRDRMGTGFEGSVADPIRIERVSSSFVYSRYKYTVSNDQEWSVAYSLTEDSGGDSFTVPLTENNTLQIDSSRNATRNTLAYQHYKTISPGLRASWGLEYQQSKVISQQLFNSNAPQSNRVWRAYINQEWKPNARWTANAGVLWEHDQLTNAELAPRVGLSWKPSPDHTVKLGYSFAFRTPSLFEQRSDWRIKSNDGQTLDIRYLSRGGLTPERIRARDIVYVGQDKKLGLTLDARLFQENITQLITGELYLLPPQEAFTPNAVAYDLINNAQATNTGLEYQLTWQPVQQTLFLLNQYFAKTDASKAYVLAAMPKRSTSFLASHTWGPGWVASVSYSQLTPVTWLGESSIAGQQRLVNLRLARAMRLANANVKWSAVWRNPIGSEDEFRELQRIPKQFWLTFSVEY